MAKNKIQFLCNHCGSVHPKWMGKCPDCGTWDSLEEYKAPTPDARATARLGTAGATGDLAQGAEPLAIADIDQADTPRIPTGIGEFDRILGGGIVPGSAVLIGGDPGIGKSTLLLQVANRLAQENGNPSAPAILYVTSEESARQTGLAPRGWGSGRPTCWSWRKPTSNGSSIRSTSTSRPWW